MRAVVGMLLRMHGSCVFIRNLTNSDWRGSSNRAFWRLSDEISQGQIFRRALPPTQTQGKQ
jgi:hypothetical protein